MLDSIIGLVDIVVTIIGIIVTLIGIVQSARNTKHQSSNRPRPRE
jgi:F0F1-type ATP synthase assembly protein I